jgi:hypothetical protein
MTNLASLAKIVLLGLLSPEMLADSFQLKSKERLNFINETTRLIHECFVDPGVLNEHVDTLSRQIVQLELDTSSSVKKQDHVQETDSGSFATSNPKSLSSWPTEPIRLAFSLISSLKDPEKRKNPDAWLSCSPQAIAIGHSMATNTALIGLSAAANTSIVGGLNAGTVLIREYLYQRKKEKRKAELDATISTAENTYLTLHQMYDIVTKHYQTSLDKLQKNHSTSSPQYRQTLEEWLLAERYFNNQIQQQQNNIAILSSLSQKEQSIRRIDRINDGISAVLSMTHFTGPPGIIASTLIKSLTCLGTRVGHGVVLDSARLNHSVTSATKILLITDKESLEESIEQLSFSVNPAVALSGPTLGSHSLIGIHNERALYTDASLAEKLVADVGGRRSCSFALSRSIPEIPIVEPAKAGQNYLNNPELKKKGKALLKTLIDAQKTLISQQDYIYALGSKMMDKHKPWPYVVNYEELSQSLSDAYSAIKKEKEQLREQMGYEYCSNPNAEGMRLLEELDTLEQNYLLKLKYTQKIGQELEKTPHSSFFHAEPRVIIATYATNPKAREMLLTDIEFNIEALDKLIDHCEKLGKGRHISNMGDAINELHAQLSILRQASKENPKSHIDWIRMNTCMEKMELIANKSAYLDKLRIEYVATSHAQEHSAAAQYQELSALERSLIGYGENLPSIQLRLPSQPSATTGKQEVSIFKQIEAVQHQILTLIAPELDNATPIDRSKLLQTDAIVSPNRVYFGLTKHEDMQLKINEKVASLITDPLLDTVQVMPLRAIDEEVIASCQGRYDQLTKLIEGLKTEIQWLNKFQETCGLNGITIANIDKLTAYYEKQIQIFSSACEHRAQILGHTQHSSSTLSKSGFAEIKAKLQNVVHEHDPELELAKAKKALASIKAYSDEDLLRVPELIDKSNEAPLKGTEMHPDL